MTSKAKCPICGRGTELAFRPFCSARCADVDLSRWLGGRYAIATHADAEEDETVTHELLAREPSRGRSSDVDRDDD